MINRLSLWLIMASAVVLMACGGGRALVGESGELYHSDRLLKTYVDIYQAEPTKAELHFEIDTDGLLYKKDETGRSIATVKVFVETRPVGQAVHALDTLSFFIADEAKGPGFRSLVGYSMIPLIDTVGYRMTVQILDVNRGLEAVHRVFLYTEDDSDRYFKITPSSTISDKYLVLRSDSLHRLDSPKLEGYELEVESYANDFPLPLPPFSLDAPAPYRGRKNTEPSVYREEDGAYMVQCPVDRICRYTDTSTGETVSLRQVSVAYPASRDIDGLIEVLRFITTKQEYDAMRYADDKRTAFEDFWLERAGSKDRAKTLIQELYSRVEEADAAFICHVDGWRTDRGIIHIIYGTPSTIIKEKDREIWTYGTDNEDSALHMTFRRVPNPFSDNDFRLERTLAYKSSWYTAVDAWRDGRIVDF